jgi:hypothetical protein
MSAKQSPVTGNGEGQQLAENWLRRLQTIDKQINNINDIKDTNYLIKSA